MIVGIAAVVMGVEEVHVLPRGDLQVEQGVVTRGEPARVQVGVRVEQGRVVAGEGEPIPEVFMPLTARRFDAGPQELLRADMPDGLAQPVILSMGPVVQTLIAPMRGGKTLQGVVEEKVEVNHEQSSTRLP
ncbi:hypothetical protein ACH419_36880 [Streptomyces bobili]|uniref:hypothetical protein n=1 Tax=Streptomyces bobili TaxID=67280 RepID=UPI00378D1ED0